MNGISGFANRLLLRQLKVRYGTPKVRRGQHAPTGLTATDVSLPSVDGSTLRGWFCRSPHADGRSPGAVVVHGWGGSAADMVPIADPLLDAGIHTLLLDARCHGRSDDAEFTSMPRFADDVAAAVQWLRAQSCVDPERVLLAGHSVGAGACLLAARDDPRIAAVVSLSSMADPAEMMTLLLTGARVPRRCVPALLQVLEMAIGARFGEFAPITTLAALRTPVLLVHGEHDDVVPPEEVQRLAAVAGDATVVLLPDAGHADLPDTTLLSKALRDFAQRTVGGHRGSQEATDPDRAVSDRLRDRTTA